MDPSDDEGSSGSDGSNDEDSSGVEAEAGSEDRHSQSWEEIAKIITGSQRRNIRHDAAKVAKSSMPFEGEDEMLAYTLALQQALMSSRSPAGFGLSAEYESVETYKTGRSSKPLVIPLPYEVWFPRIVTWCKALDLLKRLPICREVTMQS